MGTLGAAMSIASGALSVAETEIQVSDNNIANAATPGYTRETVSLAQAAPTQSGNVSVGDGVELTGVQSVRDTLLNLRIQQQTADQSSASAQENALTAVQALFPSSSSSVGSDLSTFFTSLSALSASPSSAADRQTVIANAQDLVDAFHSVANGLSATQSSLNGQVSGDVTAINQLTGQIAALNPQIAALTAQGKDGGALQDQQSQLELQLAQLTGISVTNTAEGDTITTGNGTALVVGGQSYALATGPGSGGMTAVLDSSGADITSTISGGDLGGSLQARDTAIPAIGSALDSLASGFANAFNAAQAQGFDEAGNPGGALFTVPSSVAGSAAAISLRTTNPQAIAASSDGSAGSSGNVANLTAVQSAALASGAGPTDAYAGIVDQVGNAVSSASAESSAVSLSLTQLTNQQSSVSGVSTDEESTNLIRYQQAYEAAAEVVTTLASLMNATLQMVSSSGGI